MTETPMRALETVEQVIQRMREIDRSLDRRDGIACFNRMYLRVTELVAQNIQEGAFQDAEFLERMDVIFAGLSDSPSSRGRSPARASRPAFSRWS